MKRLLISTVVFSIFVFENIIAQPFLQLDPKPMYKEDAEISGKDWAGFYRTYDKGFMLLIPNTGNNIQGIYVSPCGNTIRFISGECKGNGITYKYEEIFLGDEDTKPYDQTGTGFMVMKDDGKKENVYCKDGDGGVAVGNFTAGKKLGLILHDGAKTPNTKWEGSWKNIEKDLIAKIEKSEQPYTYIGVYTLKGYKHTDFQNNFASGSLTIKTTKMPDRTVLLLGIAYGTKLYFLSANRVECSVSAGILTQSDEKTIIWSSQLAEKVKKINEKEGEFWYLQNK